MDFLCRDDRLGPVKLARTDPFPLPKNMQHHNPLALGCPDAITGFHLAGDDHRGFYIRSDNPFGSYPRHASCAPLRSPPLLAQEIGERGVFTASQLRELQHHALIFKYLASGVNVPPELVFPIRASLAGGFAPAAHPYLASLGWGGSSYPLLYGASSTDAEPGRCRRTDGKKWRCSRDVVPDHKYCERHMHRGKHRSKKPAANPTNATSTPSPSAPASTTAVLMPLVSPSSSSVTNNPPLSMQHQPSLQQQQQQPGFVGMQARRLTAKDMGYLDGKYQHMSHAGQDAFFSVDGGQASAAENSTAISGLSAISSSSSAPRNNPLVGGAPACSMPSKEDFIGGRHRYHCQPLRHFFDDWPARARESGGGASLTHCSIGNPGWSFDDTRASASSTTQLSISIPTCALVPPPASSSSSSPRGSNNVNTIKLGLSPAALKLSMSMQGSIREEDPLQIGSQLIDINEDDHFNQAPPHEHEIPCNMSSWIPIAWESSPNQHHVAGGPLAEVLQSSTNSPRSLGCRNSGLNLMSDGWDHHESAASPPHNNPHHHHHHPAGKPIISNNIASNSPIGVLQTNATLASSSDNSTGNSPSHALNNGDEKIKNHA